MHLGMPECHKPFLGHCDLDLWPRFQELLYPEHISYIIWCRNPKFGVVIPLGMAEWCIPFWVTLTLTLASGLISSFFVLYYSYLSSNVSYTRPIPLGAFVTCLWHFLFPIRAHVNVKIITIPMDVNIIRKGYLCLNDHHTKTIDKRKLHWKSLLHKSICFLLVFFIPRRSWRDIVLALSVRPSVCPSIQSVCPHLLSVRDHISVPIGQIYFNLGANDKYHELSISYKFGQNRPFNTCYCPCFRIGNYKAKPI